MADTVEVYMDGEVLKKISIHSAYQAKSTGKWRDKNIVDGVCMSIERIPDGEEVEEDIKKKSPVKKRGRKTKVETPVVKSEDNDPFDES